MSEMQSESGKVAEKWLMNNFGCLSSSFHVLSLANLLEERLAEQREACADAVYRLTGDGEAMNACLNAYKNEAIKASFKKEKSDE